MVLPPLKAHCHSWGSSSSFRLILDSLVHLRCRRLRSLASAGLERAGGHLASLGPTLKGFDIWSPAKVYMTDFSPSCRFPNLEKQNHRIPWTPHVPQASERSLNRQLSISDTYGREERTKPRRLLPPALLLHKTNLIFPCVYSPRGPRKNPAAITSGPVVQAPLARWRGRLALVGGEEKSACSEMLLELYKRG